MEGSWHKVRCGADMLASFKVTDRGGRFVITELHVVGDTLTAGLLRTLPLARIEQLVNADRDYLERSQVTGVTDQQEPTLADLRLPTDAIQLGDSGDITETARVVEATAELVSAGTIAATAQRPKLERPDGTDPDGFYQRVADAYRDMIRSTARVTDALAAEANVPTGTSRRWINEARRRGFLPPAKQYRG